MQSKTNQASKTTSRVKDHLGHKDHQPPAEVKGRNAVKDQPGRKDHQPRQRPPRPQRPPAASEVKGLNAVKDHPGHKAHQPRQRPPRPQRPPATSRCQRSQCRQRPTRPQRPPAASKTTQATETTSRLARSKVSKLSKTHRTTPPLGAGAQALAKRRHGGFRLTPNPAQGSCRWCPLRVGEALTLVQTWCDQAAPISCADKGKGEASAAWHRLLTNSDTCPKQ
jgi:hypothetical protein